MSTHIKLIKTDRTTMIKLKSEIHEVQKLGSKTHCLCTCYPVVKNENGQDMHIPFVAGWEVLNDYDELVTELTGKSVLIPDRLKVV